jgi:hypothetical protein
MNAFSPMGPRDTPSLPEAVDLAFAGIDMRAPPLVPPGFVSSAVNKRINDGVYETRRGLFTPAWSRHASDDWPYRAAYLRSDSATWLASYATTYGAGNFSDPNGENWIVRVTAGALLFFRETEIGRIVPFSPGLSVAAPVVVFQNFNELHIVRGDDYSSLVWRGNWDAPVAELVADTVISGYADVPNSHYGLGWRDRSVLLAGRDDLIITRIADSTQYHTLDGITYVNRGHGYSLRSAVPIGDYSLLILKNRSAHIYTAILADLSDAVIDEVSRDINFEAPRTVVSVGNQIWWLDRAGVRSGELASRGDGGRKFVITPAPLSLKIAPLIRRINWTHVDTACATVWENRVYFAVPLDQEQTPGSILVFNLLLNEWESVDRFDASLAVDIVGFAQAVWLGQTRLFAVSSTGQIAALEYGLGEDAVGWVGDLQVRAPIADELITRGFTAGTNDPKKFLRAQVQLDTWNPVSVELEAIFDGPGETLALAPVARDRTKFFSAAPEFAPANTDGRFHLPRRQDYSAQFQAPAPYPEWRDGVTYNLQNDLVVWPDTNHVYSCEQTHLSARGNWYGEPFVGATYWELLGYSAPFSPQWAEGNVYSPENVVYFAITGVSIRCKREHTASLGNSPVSPASVWADRGHLNTTDPRLFLSAGIRLEDHQTKVERRDIGREAAWAQIAIRATQGSVKVRSVALDAQLSQRSNHTPA